MPLTDAQVRAAFGDPAPYIRTDGTIQRDWELLTLATARLPAPLPLSWDRTRSVMRLSVHRRLVVRFQCALGRVWTNHEAWGSIGDTGGVYAWRVMKRSKRLSRHAWGIAIDLDVHDNADGSIGNMHPFIIESFEAEGFEWGGRWSERERDPMHFEFVDVGRLAC